MEKTKEFKKREKGITLVALVVTIIVLLILAGIAINLSIGNNGLFTRAGSAANIWKKLDTNEQEEMQSFANTYDETVKNLGLDGEENKPIENPLTKITGNETEKTDTTDKEGNRIVIPAGFKVINPGSTVNDGIVVEDVSANNSDTAQNQFVWIPCTLDGANNTLKYDRYAFTRENPTWSARQSLILGTNGEYEKDADGSYKILRADETSYYYHEQMPEIESVSIERYGGFYIGRYEVGVESSRGESSKGNITANRQNKSKFTSI